MVRTPRSQTKANKAKESDKAESSIIELLVDEKWADIADRFGTPNLDDDIEMIGAKPYLDYINGEMQSILDKRQLVPQFLLVSGPPYSGKTSLIMKSIHKHKLNFSFYYLDCGWIQDKSFGDPRQSLRLLHKVASRETPSVIFIESIDAAKPEMMINFLKEFLRKPSKVLLIAETRNPNLIDQELLRARYFTSNLELKLPQPNDRLEYINSYLSNIRMHELSSSDIDQVVEWTNSYSYSDISTTCDKANKISINTNTRMTVATFEAAIKDWKPINIATTSTACEPLSWDQIGGVEEAKAELKRSIIAPLKRREHFDYLGVDKIRGALLYGPPGCSKTMLARALANESGFNFIYIQGPEYISKYVGESEAELRKLFRQAKAIGRCIIFIDEIDALCPVRTDKHDSVGSRVVATLLLELDGATQSGDVFTIGATNRPLSLDKALLRPGRLESHIYIPLPSESDRVAIFRVHLSTMRVRFGDPMDAVVEKMASLTTGFSGADIKSICVKAGTFAACEDPILQYIEWRHFKAALEMIKPSVTSTDLKSFKKFSQGQTSSTRSDNQANGDDIINTTCLSTLLARLRSSRKQ